MSISIGFNFVPFILPFTYYIFHILSKLDRPVDSVAGPGPQFCKSLTITQVSALTVSCQLICLQQSGPRHQLISLYSVSIVCGGSAVIFYQFGQFRLHWDVIFIAH